MGGQTLLKISTFNQNHFFFSTITLLGSAFAMSSYRSPKHTPKSHNHTKSGLHFLPSDLPGDLTSQQVSTALSLVAIAENSDTKWWNFYDYIENIQDGRGYTISIVGFCTGTGDFLQVLQELQKIQPDHKLVSYIDTVKGLSGGDVTGLDSLPDDVKSMGNNDASFNKAAWKVIRKLYWDPAVKYCSDNNLKSALAKYIVYDTILNFGDLDAFKDISESDEEAFLSTFLSTKQTQIENGNFGDSKNNRVDMQKSILANHNLDLTLPLKVSCYGDDYTLDS